MDKNWKSNQNLTWWKKPIETMVGLLVSNSKKRQRIFTVNLWYINKSESLIFTSVDHEPRTYPFLVVFGFGQFNATLPHYSNWKCSIFTKTNSSSGSKISMASRPCRRVSSFRCYWTIFVPKFCNWWIKIPFITISIFRQPGFQIPSNIRISEDALASARWVFHSKPVLNSC